ncbi:hypothetical protein [Virgibacillus chiguensis]|uniref:Uncharacterized protein n=1 Tax=Virgibacillus chiguensis TaxID=411959 RepID=A0A1M5QCB6_9BACI|nr:hypothetical protein [Virgibacillus chiguensis]SHH11652.1 hypothetical protein SAMN05421807_10469 [Virgibacillus chiguensis]
MNNEEMEKLWKESIYSLIKNHLETLREDTPSPNSNFVYLENNMLQIIMAYMFMNMNRSTDYSNNSMDTAELVDIENNLDSLINYSKKEFETILGMLKG